MLPNHMLLHADQSHCHHNISVQVSQKMIRRLTRTSVCQHSQSHSRRCDSQRCYVMCSVDGGEKFFLRANFLNWNGKINIQVSNIRNVELNSQSVNQKNKYALFNVVLANKGFLKWNFYVLQQSPLGEKGYVPKLSRLRNFVVSKWNVPDSMVWSKFPKTRAFVLYHFRKMDKKYRKWFLMDWDCTGVTAGWSKWSNLDVLVTMRPKFSCASRFCVGMNSKVVHFCPRNAHVLEARNSTFRLHITSSLMWGKNLVAQIFITFWDIAFFCVFDYQEFFLASVYAWM